VYFSALVIYLGIVLVIIFNCWNRIDVEKQVNFSRCLANSSAGRAAGSCILPKLTTLYHYLVKTVEFFLQLQQPTEYSKVFSQACQTYTVIKTTANMSYAERAADSDT
jgi:hypothetical protein